jgi:hypothetical protein
MKTKIRNFDLSRAFIKRNPQGMILVFILIVMVLITLMGVVILTNSRTDLATTSTKRLGHHAFNSADTSAQVAILLTRILLHPELGTPDSVLKTVTATGVDFPFQVQIGSRFDLSTIREESNTYNYQARYIGTTISPSDDYVEPHLTFRIQDQIVANAVVSFDTETPIVAGDSYGGGDAYDTSIGNLQVNMVISVNGTPSVGSVNDIDSPNTLITTIYREYM